MSGILAVLAVWMHVSPMAASAMPMPPETEPVMPVRTVTVFASFTKGRE